MVIATILRKSSQPKEFELMCPDNRVGAADVFIMSQHGNAESNGPVLVHALGPRVALMSTGTRKGGHPAAMQVLHTAAGTRSMRRAPKKLSHRPLHLS